jgi:hypothetical protein
MSKGTETVTAHSSVLRLECIGKDQFVPTIYCCRREISIQCQSYLRKSTEISIAFSFKG